MDLSLNLRNKLRHYLLIKYPSTSEQKITYPDLSNKKQSSYNLNFFSTTSRYDPFYIPYNSSTTIVNNNYYHSQNDNQYNQQNNQQNDQNNNQNDEKNDKDKGMTISKMINAAIISGAIIGTYKFLFDNYLEYKYESKMLKELLTYKNNLNFNDRQLYFSAKPLLKINTEYSWNMFVSKCMISISLLGLLFDYIYLNNLPMMYLCFGTLTLSGIYCFNKYTMYHQNETMMLTYSIHINKTLDEYDIDPAKNPINPPSIVPTTTHATAPLSE